MVKHPKPEMGTEEKVTAHRVVAIILDTIIIGVILGVFMSIGILGVPALEFGVLILLFVIGLAIWFFYSFLLEGYAGQTLGKKIMGIVVVMADGSPCTYLASFVRNLLRIVDGLGYYLIGFLVMLLSERKQRIGDHIAGTVVVKTSRFSSLSAGSESEK